MKTIALRGKHGRGKFALVDNEDYEWLNQWKWHMTPTKHPLREARKNEYGKGKRYNVWMHRLIMNTPVGMDTDHINRNPLDNRRKNLRICTHQQNCANRGKLSRKGSSIYKGVSWSGVRNKWRVNIWFGSYSSEIEAARVYDKIAKEIYGEYASLNFN